MKKITLPSCEYLMVESEHDYLYEETLNISDSEQPNWLCYQIPDGFGTKSNCIKLPPGNYTLIGLCSEISEQEAKGIVEADSRTINNGENKILLSGFKDYKRVGGSSVFTVYKTATESLASLVRSNGMEVDTTVILKQQ